MQGHHARSYPGQLVGEADRFGQNLQRRLRLLQLHRLESDQIQWILLPDMGEFVRTLEIKITKPGHSIKQEKPNA